MDLSILISNILMKYDFISAAYIFGSYGKENFNSNSDIDIAILIKENISYMEVLKIEEELEEILEYKVDLNSLRDLPEHIQLEISIRNECIYVSDDIELDKYLNELNFWYKTEYPFWLKMMTERGRA